MERVSARSRHLGAVANGGPRPVPEPAAAATAALSAYLLRPARTLPEFAAELRGRLGRVPAGAERADLAAMLAAAEAEIGLRQHRR